MNKAILSSLIALQVGAANAASAFGDLSSALKTNNYKRRKFRSGNNKKYYSKEYKKMRRKMASASRKINRK